MGCISSKQAVSVTPAVDHSGALRDNAAAAGGTGSGRFGFALAEVEKKKEKKKNTRRKSRGESGVSVGELSESGRLSSHGGARCDSVSFRLGNLHKYVEGEQVAAGWPAWLSAVAGEAIQGWVPLRPESFEKLEKVRTEFSLSLCFKLLYAPSAIEFQIL